jgi:hypothetical protein
MCAYQNTGGFNTLLMMNQDNFLIPIRAAAILTNSYVAGTVIGLNGEIPSLHNQVVLLCDFTIGSLTSASLKIETSPDNSAWYQEVFEEVTGGTATGTAGVHTLPAATGKYRYAIQVKDKYIRVSAIGTGTVTSSSLTIDAILGTA